MLLGDLIERLSDPSVAAEMLLSLEPLALGVRVDERARREHLTAGEYSARAVDRFVAAAGDEEWLTLIGHMSRSQRPGNILLQHALLTALESGASESIQTG
jgi:hypothetical protein